MKWSDGKPATSEDARWLIQTLLDGQKKDGYVGAGYLDPYLTYAGVTAVTAPDPQTLVLDDRDAEHADPDVVPPDPAQAHLGEARHRRRPERRPGRRDRAVPGRRVEDRRVRPDGPQPELLGPEGLRGRDLLPVLQERRAR